MRLLLDTATFLWLAADSPKLSDPARELFERPDNEVFLSSVSAWEIAVKHALGNLPLPDPPEVFVPKTREEMLVRSLPLDETATLYLPKLPTHHRDPFDRMLICQAIAEGLILVTSDPAIARYPVRTIW